jgi:hypothetical protein
MHCVNLFNSMSALSTFGWARDRVPSLATCAIARNDSCPVSSRSFTVNALTCRAPLLSMFEALAVNVLTLRFRCGSHHRVCSFVCAAGQVAGKTIRLLHQGRQRVVAFRIFRLVAPDVVVLRQFQPRCCTAAAACRCRSCSIFAREQRM